MSIRRWSFLIVCCMVSAILLTWNGVTYFLFRTSLMQQRLQSQQMVFQSNVRLSEVFTQTVEQLAYQYTSDQQLGRLLSAPVGEDPLRDLNLKHNLNSRIAELLNAQPLLLSHGFRVELYINGELEVSQLFLPSNTDPNVGLVFQNGTVQDQDWYQETRKLTSGMYVFLNEDQTKLCFSCQLQNSAYTGTHQRDGVGVLLGSLPLSELPNLLALFPSTPNSGFLLLNKAGDLVYVSENLGDVPAEQLQPGQSTNREPITVGGKQYLCVWQELQWGLNLAFLTPVQDITSHVLGLMSPYLICTVVFLGLGVVLSMVLSTRISRPVVLLTQKVEDIQDIRNVEWSGIPGPKEVRQLGDSFGSLIRCVNDLISELTRKEELRRESDLRALQAQINPHFMLNAMNAVNYMALERGEDDIAATVNSIASLMRYSITEPDRMVTMSTELENIQEYISIHTLRFRQQVRLEVLPGVSPDQVVIPKFTLQPLVENSIRHGMSRKEQGIEIQIQVREESDLLVIEVTDSGVGADAARLNAYLDHQDVQLQVSHGFGIRNVNERLKLSFGEQGGLCYYNYDGQRLLAKLTVPKIPRTGKA